jgi:predicted nucleic acid-binding protein
MISTLVDSNVLLDILGEKTILHDWSADRLAELRAKGRLCVNPVICAELAASLSLETSQKVLASMQITREALSFEAAWRAGTDHAAYRRVGGTRDRTLPDFLIGAHAAVCDYTLLTRDAARYRTYFPELNIIAPDTHP